MEEKEVEEEEEEERGTFLFGLLFRGFKSKELHNGWIESEETKE